MRLIARIDVKNDWVIKGIHLEGLRKVGKPNEMAVDYYQKGIDEIIFMDAVASLYDRNNLFHVIENACKNIFVPIGVGGGIRTLDDISGALNAGADKVIINTGAVKDINFISDAASKFGSQCIVGSIEAKRHANHWEAYIENGREVTGLDVIEWSKTLEEAGIGEILITSIDQEGTQRGFDIDLIASIEATIRCPIVVSGGFGENQHLSDLMKVCKPSGIACASVLHYHKENISSIKNSLLELI